MSSIFSPSLPTDGYHTCYWQGLNGSAESLALVQAAIRTEGPILLICDTNETVERYLRELSYLSSELNAYKVFALPDWETLPYDSFSPHQDIISDRLATLFSLPRMQCGIVVTSVSSLMHLLPPRRYIDANSLDLATGQKKALSDLREEMVIAGYQHVTTVMEHGEFAVRGSIVDVFPMGTALPLRIDLFDDEIDSIRRFDPETQRSAPLSTAFACFRDVSSHSMNRASCSSGNVSGNDLMLIQAVSDLSGCKRWHSLPGPGILP